MRIGYTSVECMEKILNQQDRGRKSRFFKTEASEKHECLIAPPYSSNLILEAFTEEDNVIWIRVLYNGEALDLNYGKGSSPKFVMQLPEFIVWAREILMFSDDQKFQSYCKISEYKLQEKPLLLIFCMILISNVLALVVIIVYCKGYRIIAEKHFGRTILIPIDA